MELNLLRISLCLVMSVARMHLHWTNDNKTNGKLYSSWTGTALHRQVSVCFVTANPVWLYKQTHLMIPSLIRLYWSMARFLKILLSVCESGGTSVSHQHVAAAMWSSCPSLTFSRISNATAEWWFSNGEMSLYRKASSVRAFIWQCQKGYVIIWVDGVQNTVGPNVINNLHIYPMGISLIRYNACETLKNTKLIK